MDKERVILHIDAMLKQLDDGPIRAIYMVVKELYILCDKHYN